MVTEERDRECRRLHELREGGHQVSDVTGKGGESWKVEWSGSGTRLIVRWTEKLEYW